MTHSRPSLKGSMPAMLTVSVGARRFADRSRRSVVFPAPFALGADYRLGTSLYHDFGFFSSSFRLGEGVERSNVPPTRIVRLPGGRANTTSFKPDEPSGKEKLRDLTEMDGASSLESSPLVNDIEILEFST